MSEYYTTKLLVEVEVTHYGTPLDAIDLVKINLRCPAVNSVVIKSGESNYRLWNTPDDKLTPFDLDNPFDINTSPR